MVYFTRNWFRPQYFGMSFPAPQRGPGRLADLLPTFPPSKRPMNDHRLADSQTGLQCLRLGAVKDFPGVSRFLRRAAGNQDNLAGLQRRLVNCYDEIIVVRHVKRLTSWPF